MPRVVATMIGVAMGGGIYIFLVGIGLIQFIEQKFPLTEWPIALGPLLAGGAMGLGLTLARKRKDLQRQSPEYPRPNATKRVEKLNR